MSISGATDTPVLDFWWRLLHKVCLCVVAFIKACLKGQVQIIKVSLLDANVILMSYYRKHFQRFYDLWVMYIVFLYLKGILVHM